MRLEVAMPRGTEGECLALRDRDDAEGIRARQRTGRSSRTFVLGTNEVRAAFDGRLRIHACAPERERTDRVATLCRV